MSKEVVVVGGGLAGLSAAMRLAEKGCLVKIVSVTKVKRSHSVCAQGRHQCGDEPQRGRRFSLSSTPMTRSRAGDFLADQPPVLEMCLAAPGLFG